MDILSAIANDPNVSPAFRAAVAPTKAQTAAWYELQAAIASKHAANVEQAHCDALASLAYAEWCEDERTDELKRDKQDQDRRERVLGDAWAERMGGI